MKEAQIMWRGTPLKLDGGLPPEKVYQLLFKPAMAELWRDYQSQKIPHKGVRVEISYQVFKDEQ